MLVLIKIGIAVAIGYTLLNPSFSPSPKGAANCKCSADA